MKNLGLRLSVRLLISDSFSLVDTDLFKVSISSSCEQTVFRGTDTFHLGYQFCEHGAVHSIPALSFNVHEFCSDVPSSIF